ncbi:hypothetical protein FSARC_1625 [Fusarium sarcochroum]|uniref:Uncharacterized protein n=1 Tax=Fusarium sarcochroum TaxID=1208366 RepID=A0A8H4U8A2_9HYPO|nr:hypothetical protein FSARC_1625 [Fusarium sarcochroum]
MGRRTGLIIGAIWMMIDFYYGLVFGACCGCLALIVFFCLIETKGRSLEEIDTMHLQHVNPITSAKWGAKGDTKDDGSRILMKRNNTAHPEDSPEDVA